MFVRSLRALVISLVAALLLASCGKSAGQIRTPSSLQESRMDAASIVPSDFVLDPASHDYASDSRILKESIGRIPGVTDSAIVLNGPIAYITLQLQADMDIEESMQIRNLAQAQLKQILPRYDVRVSVGKNYMY
ncbi:MAG: hypothetical protein K0R57_4947 [Paenibacillaceae bacterium]|jgi:hypothetical protein|nr:hypothetical protein [Paenibacillaceae bacterium]